MCLTTCKFTPTFNFVHSSVMEDWLIRLSLYIQNASKLNILICCLSVSLLVSVSRGGICLTAELYAKETMIQFYTFVQISITNYFFSRVFYGQLCFESFSLVFLCRNDQYIVDLNNVAGRRQKRIRIKHLFYILR